MKFVPEYLDDDKIEVGTEEEADLSMYYDMTDETVREKADLIRESLGQFDYTPAEVEKFVVDINLNLPIRKIQYALRMFTRGERNISTECKFVFPIYRDPLRIEKKKELIKYMLAGGYVDDYISDIIINHIDYHIDLKTIRDAIFNYVRSKRTRKDEERYLITIFRPTDAFVLPTEEDWKSSMKVAKIREAEPSVILPKKKPIGFSEKWDKESDMMEMEMAQVKAIRSPDRVKKTEEEVTRVMTPEIANAEFIKDRSEGNDIICVFCDKVIDTLDPMGFWYNVYPAHLSCIHKRLDEIDEERAGH